MGNALETLSKKDLIALLNREREEKEALAKNEQKYTQKIADLQFQLDQYKRILFGQKRERFEATDKNQLSLPFEIDTTTAQKQEQEFEEKRSNERTKRKSTHKGRMPLPEHLDVEEIEIYPEGDLSDKVCIGKEVTEELEYEPAKYYIKRYIRYKYAPKDQGQSGVVIGTLPQRVIDKGIPGVGLLTSILVDKYLDHLPLHRQLQRFKRNNIPIASSTLEGWVRQSLNILDYLYQPWMEDIKNKGYLQVDETSIKVIDKQKKGTTHFGYYWVYHSPVDNTILFDYQPSRSQKAADYMLEDFKGYLQSDGYSAYEKIGRREGVTHLCCMVHARREFEKALKSDKVRAEIALTYIQRIYKIEAKAREEKLSPAQRKELRLQESLPILNEFGKWLVNQLKQGNILPKSPLGKAIHYSLKRWDQLNAFLYDGILEPDNNLIENAIRPIALGRKNYLFAGSHDAAQRSAIMYSFFASCKKNDVNPAEWLKYTLENIMTINHKNIRELYPQNYKKMIATKL